MDGTNHSRGSTIQSLSPDNREGLEHELRPEALASIAREENAEASTNTTHAAVSPKESTKTRAETASTGLVPPHESSTHTDRAVRTEASVDDKGSLAIDFDGEGGFLEAPKKQRPTKAPPKHLDRVRRFYGSFPTSRCVEAMVNGIFYRVHGSVVQGAPAVAQTRCVMIQGVAASSEANMYLLQAIARRRADRGLCVVEIDNIGIGHSTLCGNHRRENRTHWVISTQALDGAPRAQGVYDPAHGRRRRRGRETCVGGGRGAPRHRPQHGPVWKSTGMGGMIAMEYAARTKAVASLTLLSTTPRRRCYADAVPQIRAIPTGVAILCAGSREARVRADHRFHFTASYLDGAFTDEEQAFFGAESTFGRSSRREFWVEEYLSSDSQHASENQPKNVLNNQVKATLAWSLSDDSLRALRRLRILIVHGANDLVVRPSSARQFHRVLEGRADGSCCGRGVAAAVAPESRAKLLMLDDAAHMTIFSHPTRIAEAVDELWGGALRYEEEF